MILYYDSTYPNAVIQNNNSDIVLHVDSDDAYIVFPNVCSHTVGHLFLRIFPPPKPSKLNPKQNGSILSEVKAINNIVSSAA